MASNPFSLKLNTLEQREPFFSVHSHRARLDRFLAGNGAGTLLLPYRRGAEAGGIKGWNRADDAVVMVSRAIVPKTVSTDEPEKTLDKTPEQTDDKSSYKEEKPRNEQKFDVKTIFLRPLKDDVLLSRLPRIASRDSFHRVAYVPKTGELLRRDKALLEREGFRRYVSRDMQRLLLQLRRVLPDGNPLGLRIDRDGTIRLGTRWAWRPAEFWTDKHENPVRLYDLLKTRDGRWYEVTETTRPYRLRAERADKAARHGITVLGRTVSECYHRVNVYAAEVKRHIIVELLHRLRLVGEAERHSFELPLTQEILADALRVYSDEFRDRRMQAAEEQAAKMSTKLIFPLVLFMFPVFFIVAIGPAVLRIIDAFAKTGGG